MEISALNQDGGFSRQGVLAIRSIVMEILAEECLLGKPHETEASHVPPTPASVMNDKSALRQEIREVLGEQNAVSPGVSEERVMELLDAQTRVLSAQGRLSAIPRSRFLTH